MDRYGALTAAKCTVAPMSGTIVDVVILACVAALWGASLGSFACVVIERGWRNIGGRSRCACGRPLSWWENVPVAAWPLLRGRARCCGAAIPVHYWVVEVAFCGAWAAAAVTWGVRGLLIAGASTAVAIVLTRVALRRAHGR